MVQPGAGPNVFQYPGPNLAPFAFNHSAGMATPVGSALQYGLDPGLAKYCWW